MTCGGGCRVEAIRALPDYYKSRRGVLWCAAVKMMMMDADAERRAQFRLRTKPVVKIAVRDLA